MKKQQPKLMNLIFIIILYILAVAFFAYGIYIVNQSFDYVQSYQSSSYISDQNRIQYVINSSIIYFGIGLISLIGAVILTTLNRLQKNIYETILHLNNRISSSYDYTKPYLHDDNHQQEFTTNKSSRRKRRS